MAQDEELVCGIDIGTSAARALVCDLRGQVRGRGCASLAPVRAQGLFREQDAASWWQAACEAVHAAVVGVDNRAIAAVAVDATSGTMVMVDRGLQPMGTGLMYNDGRAIGESDRINAAAADFTCRLGYRFKDDFSLAKILWLQKHDRQFAQAWKILHQADFINSRLAGYVTATDWSNALKTGADCETCGWPPFLAALGVPLEKLPERIVPPAVKIGEVCAGAASATGLPRGAAIIAGATDGVASLLASGAHAPGDFATALGSTIAIRGISPSLLRDPDGVLYCHRHPEGYWLPGGASNAGCAALDREFAADPAKRSTILDDLSRDLDHHLPSSVILYPLGDMVAERFPFKRSDLAAFVVGEIRSRQSHFAAMLQALAFVERWCYEKIESLGCTVQRIFSLGGGSHNAAWRRLRVDVMRKEIILPATAETAFGAAILAAAYCHGSVSAAGAAMAATAKRDAPSSRSFEAQYAAFRAEIHRRWGV